jgi:hypothetical protein
MELELEKDGQFEIMRIPVKELFGSPIYCPLEAKDTHSIQEKKLIFEINIFFYKL